MGRKRLTPEQVAEKKQALIDEVRSLSKNGIAPDIFTNYIGRRAQEYWHTWDEFCEAAGVTSRLKARGWKRSTRKARHIREHKGQLRKALGYWDLLDIAKEEQKCSNAR